jgi:hypothetical protein
LQHTLLSSFWFSVATHSVPFFLFLFLSGSLLQHILFSSFSFSVATHSALLFLALLQHILLYLLSGSLLQHILFLLSSFWFSIATHSVFVLFFLVHYCNTFCFYFIFFLVLFCNTFYYLFSGVLLQTNSIIFILMVKQQYIVMFVFCLAHAAANVSKTCLWSCLLFYLFLFADQFISRKLEPNCNSCGNRSNNNQSEPSHSFHDSCGTSSSSYHQLDSCSPSRWSSCCARVSSGAGNTASNCRRRSSIAIGWNSCSAPIVRSCGNSSGGASVCSGGNSGGATSRWCTGTAGSRGTGASGCSQSC